MFKIKIDLIVIIKKLNLLIVIVEKLILKIIFELSNTFFKTFDIKIN